MSPIFERMAADLSLSGEDLLSILRSWTQIGRTIKVPKRSGKGHRKIVSPSPSAKLIQTWIAKNIISTIDTSPHASAFRTESSIKKNALIHCNQKFIIKIDIKDFFPSIDFNRLKGVLIARIKSLPDFAQSDMSNCLALIEKFCFDRERRLPQGYSSSPVISNSVMQHFDRELVTALRALSLRIKYSRYADDLSISFNNIEFKDQIELLTTQLLKKHGFNANTEKTKFGIKSSGSMYVNGIKICHDGRLTIHRDYKDKVRGLFYAFDSLNTKEKRSLLGHVYYIRHVDPLAYNKIARKYLAELRQLRALEQTNAAELKQDSI